MRNTLNTVALLIVHTLALAADDYQNLLEGILELDNINSEAAIPQLREILTTSDNIREYAAAQALFLLDTPEAHAILKKHVFSEDYDICWSIKYALGWNMRQPERGTFINKYHLQHRSNDVSIELGVKHALIFKDIIEFTITLRNTSDQMIRLIKPLHYLGEKILLVSPTGHFLPSMKVVMYKMKDIRGPDYPIIPPGKKLILTLEGEIKFQKESGFKELSNSFILDTWDCAHKLDEPGKYKAYAIYCFTGIRNPPYDNIWKGSVVSEPVELDIRFD